MFRPFLPCGIAYGFAYGFAYALPMALPMAFHALFPAEGIPPGCLYCTISARCLSTGFGRISAAFAFFRRRGVPPCRGGIAPALPARRALAAPYGGRALFVACLPCLWFLILPPIPPAPFPGGEGGDQGYFHARGFAPCIPGAGWDTALALLVENRFLRLQMERWHPPGGGNPDCKKPLPLCICMAGAVSAASGSVQGCRGRSPRRNKL